MEAFLYGMAGGTFGGILWLCYTISKMVKTLKSIEKLLQEK